MTDHYDTILPLDIDLVRYDEPTLVEDSEEYRDGNAADQKSERHGDGDGDCHCDEILRSVLPPSRLVDGHGTRWTRNASNQLATRADVVALTEKFDASLLLCGARDAGVCPIRRALYSRCFDEILRQVTVNCAERGLLLLKVGDEFKTTVDAYRTLYESNVKLLNRTKSVLVTEPDVRHRVAELEAMEAKKQRLERDLAASIAKHETVQRRGDERRADRQRTHDIEKEFLTRSNRDLKTFLDGKNKTLK